MYPKNSASPPKLFATVVKAADGTAITSGVAAKYSTGAGSQAAGGGTCQHENNGQWSYAPTQAETNVDGFGVQFYHADAVGSGPTISVVTTASVVQTGDSFARLGAPSGSSVSADIAAVAASVAAIGSGTGAALNYEVTEDNASSPIKTVSSVGTQTGIFSNTLANDGTLHRIASVGNAIDWVYGFNVGAARAASKVILRANMAATGDTVTVSAYDFPTMSWDVRTTITGTTETTYDIPLLAAHTGTGADEGKVYIRFQFAEGDAGTLVIDEAYCQAQQSGSLTGYALGAIWVNTAVSNTNTVPYVDGTADNPVSTWAAALTLSAALGIKRFKIAAASSITLTADSSEYEMLGDGLWSLALGGQDISNSYIVKASLTGVASGSNAIIEDALVNPGVSTGPAYFVRCGFNTSSGSPFLAASAGQYVLVDCVSTVAGSGTPYFNFAGTGSTTGVNIRRWSGGTNITLDSNVTATIEVVTGGGQTVTTGGGNVEIRGIFRTATIALSASETVQIAGVTGPITVSGAAVAATVNLYGVHATLTNTATGAAVNDYAVSLPNINTQADTALADYDPPTNAEITAAVSAVVLDPAQPGVTFSGQVKITADALGEGALHVVNTNAIAGDGMYVEGKNDGMHVKATAAAGVGLLTEGGYGMHNNATVVGLYNNAPTPQVGSITGNLTGSVGSVTAGVTLADDAIAASKFDETTAFPLKSADTGATAVARTGADSDTLETLSDQIDTIDASGTAAAVWSYTSRTLTALPAATTDGTTAGSITRKRGDSWSISLTVGAITGYTSLWLTVKSDTGDADASSLLMVKKNASLTGDGLLYVNGATAGDATKGSITVSNATTGAITIAVDESVTDDMAPGSYSYDVQTLVSGAVTTVDSGTFAITPDVTRAIA